MNTNTNENKKVVVLVSGRKEVLNGPVDRMIVNGFVTDVYLNEEGKRVDSLGLSIYR